jgi:hypothetical protein
LLCVAAQSLENLSVRIDSKYGLVRFFKRGMKPVLDRMHITRTTPHPLSPGDSESARLMDY